MQTVGHSLRQHADSGKTCTDHVRLGAVGTLLQALQRHPLHRQLGFLVLRAVVLLLVDVACQPKVSHPHVELLVQPVKAKGLCFKMERRSSPKLLSRRGESLEGSSTSSLRLVFSWVHSFTPPPTLRFLFCHPQPHPTCNYYFLVTFSFHECVLCQPILSGKPGLLSQGTGSSHSAVLLSFHLVLRCVSCMCAFTLNAA